jgi:hypothetical protein
MPKHTAPSKHKITAAVAAVTSDASAVVAAVAANAGICQWLQLLLCSREEGCVGRGL